jgi:hypothetical protein
MAAFPGRRPCELFEILTAFVKVHRLIAVIRAVRSSTRKETDSSPGEPWPNLGAGGQPGRGVTEFQRARINANSSMLATDTRC